MFKKRTLIGELLLRVKSRKKHKQYRYELANFKLQRDTAKTVGSHKLFTLPQLKEFALHHKSINVVHSGNIGDIIYALPTLKRMHELCGLQIKLYLGLGKTIPMPAYRNHPLGNVTLNQQMANLLLPLIREQGYLNSCDIYKDEKIDIDLDVFRTLTIPTNSGNLAHWYSYITGVSPQLFKSWLTVTPDKSYANTIIISRSMRYRNPVVNFSFLARYQNLIFLGIQEEYEDLALQVPRLKWVKVANFKQMAEAIAGCKFFIGNQSFAFALAEGLKVPRVLETYYHVPNVIPEGEGGHDFYFQNHFEALVQELNAGALHILRPFQLIY